MMGGMEMMTMGGMGVVRCPFMLARVMMVRRLLVMTCRVLVVLSRLAMVLCCLYRHEYSPLLIWRARPLN